MNGYGAVDRIKIARGNGISRRKPPPYNFIHKRSHTNCPEIKLRLALLG
jgi:hypothetical protein